MNSDPYIHSSYCRFLNDVALPLHSRIRGRQYSSIKSFVEKSQWSNREELEEFQFQEFRKILRAAFNTVPFYQRRYAEAGVRYEDIQRPSDICKLPILERDDVKRHRDELRSTAYKGKLLLHSTGGSTGTPVQFFRTPESCDWRTAVTARAYAWTGAALGERTLYLWGAPTGEAPLWKRIKMKAFNWARNEFVVDSFHRPEDFWNGVLRKIHEVQPRVLVGYTSNIAELCSVLRERRERISTVRTVLAAAEPVYPDLYERVRESLGAQLFNTYGSREFMSIAVECGRGNLHVNMENVYLENEHEGHSSDLLVTDLHNYGTLFIRYRIGDSGLVSRGDCQCGRSLHNLAALEGKTWDILRTTSGSAVSGIVVRHFLKDVSEVRQFQAEQTDYDRIVLRVVLQKPLSNASRRFLNAEFHKAFGSGLELVIEEVPYVSRTASGKQRCVIGLPAEKVCLLEATVST